MGINVSFIGTDPYTEYLSYLMEKYPVPDVEIYLDLYWSKTVRKGENEVEGLFSWISSDSCRIAIAIGAPDRTIKDNFMCLAHEYKHCLQYYIEGRYPASGWDYEIEAEAYQFAAYLTNDDYNTSYMEVSDVVMRKLRDKAIMEGRTIDKIIEDALG